LISFPPLYSSRHHILIYVSYIMAVTSWEVEANKCKEILAQSIPKQWMVAESSLPGAEELHVVDFCRTSGLLSEKELAITESPATALVEKMGKGALSAEEVVIAFLKRATIGQQLVSYILARQ
jgi:amidase